MFKQGQIVKSNTRTNEYPLFLMVIADPNPISEQFNAIVIYDHSIIHDEEGEKDYQKMPGFTSNNWNTLAFIECGWSEIKKYLK